MCGIAGRVNYLSQAPVSREVVTGMCELLAHRGPDGQGVKVEGAVGFGHRRLAIIDLSPAGAQPMTTPDGEVWITFNGEIYNFLELRRDLESKGHRFRTRTDTEVLLAAYREYGVECLSRLCGMFAFAIWDAQSRSLFIARDRLGKKPLHYAIDSDGIMFASEPKAFFADPRFEARVDLGALSDYLSYQYVPCPRSAFEGVRKLPPAHYLLVANGRLSVNRYWKLTYREKRRLTEQEACEELLVRLREAVRARLISDVPLGAFLSGGIDSSAIVALMAESGSGPVKTFSIGFEDHSYDELPYARQVAAKYETDHHEFIVRPDAAEIFPQLVWHYNEPYADASAIPTYYLSRLTRQHVTVALNGDAGDENFAGYRRYIATPAAQRFDALPAALRRSVAAVAGALPAPPASESFMYRAREWMRRLSADAPDRYARRVMHFEPDLKRELVTDSFSDATHGRDSIALLVDAYAASDAPDFVDAMLDLDVNHYLPDCLLVKVDIATMAHGLEGRSPMLDHRFMEFAASLPSAMKLRGGVTKYIFKKAVRDLLPPANVDRPKKGFSVPLAPWFRNELRELTKDLLLDGRLERRGYFRMGLVRRLVDEHVRGAANWERHLWNLVMLESWHRMFIDERPQRAGMHDRMLIAI